MCLGQASDSSHRAAQESDLKVAHHAYLLSILFSPLLPTVMHRLLGGGERNERPSGDTRGAVSEGL